jgi:LacI family kdg operon repressor
MNDKKVTISDIAKASGVSTATVSRYISGKESIISEKTCEKIKKVIELTGYQPSELARNLKNSKTNLIGVSIADISSPFSSAIIIGITEVLSKNGYTPLLINNNNSFETEKENIKSLINKGIAGLIINTTSFNNNELVELDCKNITIVLCDRTVKDHKFNLVSSEKYDSIKLLVKHLKDQGFTRVYLVTEPWEQNSSRIIRIKGFIEGVMENYQRDANDDIYLIEDDASCMDKISKLMNSCKCKNCRPAIIGINSVSTVKVFTTIKKLGLTIPDDIGLCGPEDWDWDNTMNWPTLLTPNITTIKIHSTQMGREAAQLLVDKLKNGEKDKTIKYLPCELIVRESTSGKRKNNDE